MAYRKKSQAAHRRVLATRRDAKSPPKGNTRAVRTGAGANGVNLPGFEQTKAEVQGALEHATWIQPCDLLLLDVFTRELHAYRHAADVLARLGDRAIQKKVNATKLQIRRARVLGELADRLGFSPLARSRLGLTVAKTEAIRVQPVRTADRARAVAELLQRSGHCRQSRKSMWSSPVATSPRGEKRMSNREFDLSNETRSSAKVTVVSYDVSAVGQSGARTFSHLSAEPGRLPSDGALREFLSALQDSRERKRALWWERGILAASARRYGIGWDGGVGAWVLPVRDARGKLVNVTTRPPKGGAMWGPGGRTEHPVRVRGRTALTGGLPLYPAAPSGRAWLLCAGEWDALVAIQAGLPAVTGLCGCRWLSAWDTQARGKRIAVAYDCGEEKPAALTVEHLRAAGAAEAWVVALGLGQEGADVCDWFRPTRYSGYGRTPEELVQLIRDARP